MCRAAPSAGTDIVANAQRDAQRLVSCMTAFDATCAAELTYSKFLEQHGVTQETLLLSADRLNRQLRSADAHFVRFVLATATEPFSGDGNDYLFVPYVQVLEVRGKVAESRAYFIGISADKGKSWKFVDGVRVTQQNIRMIIPSFGPRQLPQITSMSQRKLH
jgi:hypothetical protein